MVRVSEFDPTAFVNDDEAGAEYLTAASPRSATWPRAGDMSVMPSAPVWKTLVLGAKPATR
jgi:hypothetical protein